MKTYPLPTSATQSEALILANGEFPTHSIPTTILSNSSYLVCCDGAIDELAQKGIQPHAIVGDCDSLSLENKLKYKDIVCEIKEQETNDLTKSVNFCISRGKKNIIILGATGKREDHTIGNISLLAEYINYVEDVCIITNYGIFNAITSDSIFDTYPGQQISLFCITPTELTIEGVLYPVKQETFTNWWQATLNEAINNQFIVRTKGKTIIFRAFT